MLSAQKFYTVLDANNTETSMPYKLAQQKLLRESDMIMGLVTSDAASPFVLNDLNSAKQTNREAVVLIGKDIKPLGLDPSLKQFSLSMESDDTQLVNLFPRKDKL